MNAVKLITSGLIGLVIAVGIFKLKSLLFKRGGYVKTTETKRNPENEDKISFDLPDLGYDSTDTGISTDLETLSERDEVDISPFFHQTKNKKKLDHRRTRDRQKKGNRYRK